MSERDGTLELVDCVNHRHLMTFIDPQVINHGLFTNCELHEVVIGTAFLTFLEM